MGLKDELIERARELSFDLVGIANPFCDEIMRAPVGNRPVNYLPGAKSVIVLGMKVLDSVLKTAPSGIYSKHYDTINDMLNAGAYRLSKWLEKQGYRSIYFPETDSYEILWAQYNAGLTSFVPCFNHMAVAEASGLGKKGVSGVVLTPQYGPRQRWISVITEAPLEFSGPMDDELCLHKKGMACLNCVSECPVKAVSLEGTDVRKCWIHWTSLRDEGKACGLCIKVCPVGFTL